MICFKVICLNLNQKRNIVLKAEPNRQWNVPNWVFLFFQTKDYNEFEIKKEVMIVAVSSTPVGSKLKISVQTGLDEKGDAILRNRSYNNVKTTATDEDLMDVAKQLAGLQIHPVNAIYKVTESHLTEEV